LAPLLDETHRWDRELSQDEQLCLAFARILLQAPPWVLIDGTFSTLDDDVLELVIDVFNKELQQTGILHIGGAGQAHRLFATTLHLMKAPAIAPLDKTSAEKAPPVNSPAGNVAAGNVAAANIAAANSPVGQGPAGKAPVSEGPPGKTSGGTR
jgi:energy-coupling factor transporter ATP-binding protein EcfA2